MGCTDQRQLPKASCQRRISRSDIFCVRGADVLSGSSQLEQVVNFVAGNTVWIVDVSVRTGDCDNFRAQLVQLQRGTPDTLPNRRLQLSCLPVFHRLLPACTARSKRYHIQSLRICRSGRPGQTFTSQCTFESVNDLLVLTIHVTDFSSPTPRSPAGTSVEGPMCLYNSVMKAWQKRITSASDLPVGSKFAPPLPPPIGRPVRLFLKICSNPGT